MNAVTSMPLPGQLDLDYLRTRDHTGLLADIDQIVAWELPMRMRFRGITRRDGLLVHGPAGWGEVAPFWNYDADAAAPWLASGLEQATGRLGGGDAQLPVLRRRIPVNVTIPEVSPDVAQELVTASGATTAKVKVASTGRSWGVAASTPSSQAAPHGLASPAQHASPSPAAPSAGSARHAMGYGDGIQATQLAADLERLEAVRAALGPQGRIRIDVNGMWSLDQARTLLPLMDRAAGGLEYAEQPCASVEDMAALRRTVDVPLAADESIRLAADPLEVVRREAADVAVLKVAPLGGVGRALALAEAAGLPAVVSSALDTSVGIAAGAQLAAALQDLSYACGLGTASLFSADVAVPSLIPAQGFLTLTAAHVSRTMLAGVAADGALVDRWQTRMVHMMGALAARREQERHDRDLAVAGVLL